MTPNGTEDFERQAGAVDTMQENIQWLTEQVRPNSRAARDRPR
jgi:hypothetical protein